jgi:hypothetical protein
MADQRNHYGQEREKKKHGDENVHGSSVRERLNEGRKAKPGSPYQENVPAVNTFGVHRSVSDLNPMPGETILLFGFG